MVAKYQNNQNSQVTGHSESCDYPGETAQEGKAQQVLAGVKSIWIRGALDEGAVKTIKLQVWILKVDVIKKIHAFCRGLPEEYTDVTITIKIPEHLIKENCVFRGQCYNYPEVGTQKSQKIFFFLLEASNLFSMQSYIVL